MKTELKTNLSKNKTLLILSFISILLGLIACLLGELIVPLLVGVLSVIYLFEGKTKPPFGISVSLILLVLNVGSVIIGLSVSLFAPAAIILSFILASAFRKGNSKADAAYVMTIIAALLSLLGYLLFAMLERQIFSFDAAFEYYAVFIENLRPVFVDTMTDIYTASGVKVTAEIIDQVYTQQINLIISYFLITAFAMVGIGMKLFSAITRRLSYDPYSIEKWSFGATRVYGYFYLLLVILSLFTADANSVFSVVVLNLYSFFMIVFAYVGFKTVREILAVKMKPAFATLLIIAVLVVFASFGAQILAALGVLYSVRIYETTFTKQ